MRKGGLEPPRFYPPDPKSGASANSATFATFKFYRLHAVRANTQLTVGEFVGAGQRFVLSALRRIVVLARAHFGSLLHSGQYDAPWSRCCYGMRLLMRSHVGRSASFGQECMRQGLVRTRPRAVALILGHLLRYFRGLFAKIFLIDHAGLIDDESHDSAGPIFRGIRDKTEAARTL